PASAAPSLAHESCQSAASTLVAPLLPHRPHRKNSHGGRFPTGSPQTGLRLWGVPTGSPQTGLRLWGVLAHRRSPADCRSSPHAPAPAPIAGCAAPTPAAVHSQTSLI